VSPGDAGGDPGPVDAGRDLYRRSGVNVAAADRAVSLIRDVAAGASRPEVVGGVGGFAGLVSLGDHRLLAAATDGVGTKLEVARLAGRLDTVGIDLVAMCANDVVCTGAEPLFFLDYLAVARVIPEEVAAIVAGVAEGCRRAGCALLGGETAEHPGTLESGRFDLAGFCVGILREEDLLGPDRVRAGDALVGLHSTGLHANGFTLVRRVLLGGDPGQALHDHVPELDRTLAEELLEPTAMYVRPLLALAREGLVHSAAHITGGGFQENVPRALPPGLGAVLDMSAWTPPPVFGLLAARAGVEVVALASVVNLGIGMVVAVSDAAADDAVRAGLAAGVEATVIGRVIQGAGIRLE
jgi:phosphoribosylformylglycinamidine cyclo-ligase